MISYSEIMKSVQGRNEELSRYETHHRCLQAVSLDQEISPTSAIMQQDFEETMRKWGPDSVDEETNAHP
jgi:hypothetical protein